MPKKGSYSALPQQHTLQQTPHIPELEIEISVKKLHDVKVCIKTPASCTVWHLVFPALVRSPNRSNANL